jgi:hypothetical protein
VRVSSVAHASHLPAPTHHSAVHTPSRLPPAQSSPLGAVSSSSLGLSSFHSPNISTPLNVSSSPSSSALPNHHKTTQSSVPSLGTGEIPATNHETSKQKTNIGHHSSSKFSLPNSSQPSVNSDSSAMLPPPVPSRAPQSIAQVSESVDLPAETAHRLLGSLRDTSVLYNLSRVDLENLVSHVVREEGFTELVCDLLILTRHFLNVNIFSSSIWIQCGE